MGINIKTLASGSSGNCYHVTDGITPILIDPGIPWRKIQQGLNFQTSQITGCFISHGHMDHCKAVKDIINRGIDAYLSPETATILGLADHHRIHEIEPEQQTQVGTWIVKAFQAEHDIAGSLGFLFYSKATKEKLVYITDSYFCRYVFNGLTHVMLEINYDIQTLNENIAAGSVPVEMKNRLLKSHFSLENAVDFLKANNLKKVKGIWVLHTSEGNANIDRIRTTVQKVTGKPVYIV